MPKNWLASKSAPKPPVLDFYRGCFCHGKDQQWLYTSITGNAFSQHCNKTRRQELWSAHGKQSQHEEQLWSIHQTWTRMQMIWITVLSFYWAKYDGYVIFCTYMYLSLMMVCKSTFDTVWCHKPHALRSGSVVVWRSGTCSGARHFRYTKYGIRYFRIR